MRVCSGRLIFRILGAAPNAKVYMCSTLYCQLQTQLSKDVTASIRISVRYFTYGEINSTPPLVHPISPLRVPAQRREKGTGWHCYRWKRTEALGREPSLRARSLPPSTQAIRHHLRARSRSRPRRDPIVSRSRRSAGLARSLMPRQTAFDSISSPTRARIDGDTMSPSGFGDPEIDDQSQKLVDSRTGSRRA